MAEKQYTSFYIGESLFAIDILVVREINRHMDITPVERAPEFIKGLLNLRGQIVNVIDLGIKLGIGKREITNKTCCMVLKTNSELIEQDLLGNEEAKTSEDLVGLLVDQIGDMVAVDSADIEQPPANVGSVEGKFIEGVIKQDGKLVVTLRIDRILEIEEV